MKIIGLATIEELAMYNKQDVKWFYFLHVFGYLKLYSFGEEVLCVPSDYESACADWVIYWLKTQRDLATIPEFEELLSRLGVDPIEAPHSPLPAPSEDSNGSV